MKKRSQAAWREMRSALPMSAQLAPRLRKASTCDWSMPLVASPWHSHAKGVKRLLAGHCVPADKCLRGSPPRFFAYANARITDVNFWPAQEF
jgi:hypothetical protein